MIKGNFLIEIKEISGVKVFKVKHDKNGNPRYMVHKSVFNADYNKAKEVAKSVGFTQCKAHGFLEYLICVTYKGYEGVLELIDLAKK